jgi:hypothetical protein
VGGALKSESGFFGLKRAESVKRERGKQNSGAEQGDDRQIPPWHPEPLLV